MADKIKLVQGDTLPEVDVVIRDDVTLEPIDISGGTVLLKFREAGSTTVKETLTGTLLNGLLNADGSISTVPPYNVVGKGGRVRFAWTETALDTAGSFEGEVEVTLPNLGVQTVYEKLKFQVRKEF